jgi:hypothetical protein
MMRPTASTNEYIEVKHSLASSLNGTIIHSDLQHRPSNRKLVSTIKLPVKSAVVPSQYFPVPAFKEHEFKQIESPLKIQKAIPENRKLVLLMKAAGDPFAQVNAGTDTELTKKLTKAALLLKGRKILLDKNNGS